MQSGFEGDNHDGDVYVCDCNRDGDDGDFQIMDGEHDLVRFPNPLASLSQAGTLSKIIMIAVMATVMLMVLRTGWCGETIA